MSDETQEDVTHQSSAAEQPAGADDVYSKDELADLTKALGQVVLGAGMSEKSGAFGLMREIMAAMSASAVFVGDSSNPLLKQIVTDAGRSDDDATAQDQSSISAEQAVENGIVAARRSYELLLGKGQVEDADAWAQLLLTAANAAVQATKTGGFLGFGGEKITTSEQAYMQRLADTLGYKKETTA